jgi:hypothetical protein
MKSMLLALTILLGTASAAFAQCESRPDDVSTGYTANQTALALCRQREMSERVQQQQQQVELQGQLNQLEMQIRLNDQFARARQSLSLPQF